MTTSGRKLVHQLAHGVLPVMPKRVGVAIKHMQEMAFWKDRHAADSGELRNAHYRYFYTSYFDIDVEEYRGRSILDIGCGPRGSLEWANCAKERVGLDPLADRYRTLGTARHRMQYVCVPSEKIPFPDEHFDFVTCFNALDHVEDISRTLSEVNRIIKKNGTFLLITEINHAPTFTEPHSISEELLDRLSEGYVLSTVRLCQIRGDHDVYGSLRDNIPYTGGSDAGPGLLSAKMIKKVGESAPCREN